jgi:hypothetical protein
MKEKIDEEMVRWQPYYNNYEALCINILVDVLAFVPKDKRADMISKVDGLLESLENSTSSEQMITSIEDDLNNFKFMNDEAAIALRTLQWVKDEMEKETK